MNKQYIETIVLFVLAALTCGCASVSVKTTDDGLVLVWLFGDHGGPHYRNK